MVVLTATGSCVKYGINANVPTIFHFIQLATIMMAMTDQAARVFNYKFPYRTILQDSYIIMLYYAWYTAVLPILLRIGLDGDHSGEVGL
jgi:hypothetical protein